MFDPEGYFDTGDLVRIHPDGRMEFLGREKYWIYDNGAEAKFNPEDVEGLLKVIAGVVNAIILSRFEHVGKFVPENPSTNRSITAILASDLTYERLLPQVVEVNKKLPRLHKISAFIVASPKEWEPGKGLVTETFKPRRGPICKFYEKQLDELYVQIDKNGGRPLIAWQ
jgi:long-subunit acyl-CoA synthetase (AMP-forming)